MRTDGQIFRCQHVTNAL